MKCEEAWLGSWAGIITSLCAGGNDNASGTGDNKAVASRNRERYSHHGPPNQTSARERVR